MHTPPTATKPKGTINIYFSTQYQKYHARIYRRGRFYHVGRYVTKCVAEQKAQEQLDRMPELPPAPDDEMAKLIATELGI